MIKLAKESLKFLNNVFIDEFIYKLEEKGRAFSHFFTPKQKFSERYVQLLLANFGTWSGSLGLHWCELKKDTLLLLWWSSYESYGRSLMKLRAVNDILLNGMT